MTTNDHHVMAESLQSSNQPVLLFYFNEMQVLKALINDSDIKSR